MLICWLVALAAAPGLLLELGSPLALLNRSMAANSVLDRDRASAINRNKDDNRLEMSA